MSRGYFTIGARIPPKPKPDVHLFIVFDNDVCDVLFSEDDPDVYFLEDERLDDQELWNNTNEFFNMFMDDIDPAGQQGRRIIVIHYNPMTAQCVREFFKIFEKQERIQWHTLSFFHNDEDTEGLGLNWSDVLMAKVYAIESMNNFPWIKKLEVEPYNTLYHRDLMKLVLSEEDFKELDDENEEPYARLDSKEPPQLTWTTLPKPDSKN
ncbi:MAG: hypothetical protein LBD79_04705 [Treponema sp.]|jgi:hypothetical protein|nr:hypothetical protein [Treponema sp.]